MTLFEDQYVLQEPDDEETVREALKTLQDLAFEHRYGGLWRAYALAKEALEAFERLVEPEQGRLL